MGKGLESNAAALPWLWSFDNDYIRLLALIVVGLTVTYAIGGRRLTTKQVITWILAIVVGVIVVCILFILVTSGKTPGEQRRAGVGELHIDSSRAG